MKNFKIAFVMMESIYPQRGGIHEEVYLLLKELTKRGIYADIVAKRFRRANEKGGRLLWLRMAAPTFIMKLSKYDILITETAWSILPALISKIFLRKQCILHLHSVESIQDVGLGKVGKAIIKILERLGKFCDAILVPSGVELELAINELKYPKNKTYILPNVIDFEEFQKYEPAKLERPAIVFVGGMNYPPNREAAETIIKIAKKLAEKGINANFYLVGPSPPKVKPPVYATGYVESTKPYIKGADILIAPIFRGGGIKLKMLEYMASGKPIIATRKATEGIDEIIYINAETVDEFVDRIIDVLYGKITLDFSKNIMLVKEKYIPSTAVEILLKILENLNDK